MDKVLVLGASSVQLPLIHELRQRGFYIYAVSNIQEDKAREEVDEFHLISSTNFPKIKELIEAENITNVFTIGSDVALRTLTKLSSNFGWANHPTPVEFENLHNKSKVRKILHEEGLSIIQCKCVREYSDHLFDFDEYKRWVIKPVDGYGSKGIYHIEEYHDKKKYFNLALAVSVERQVIIEPFIEGRQLTIEFFVTNEEKVISMMTIEKLNNSSFVPYLYLVKANTDYVEGLNHISRALKLKPGFYNVDLIETKAGLELMDIAPRLGGNHLALLYQYTFGSNSVADYVNFVLEGTAVEKRKHSQNTGLYIIHSEKGGKVTSVDKNPKFINSLAHELWATTGDKIEAFTEGNRQQGYIIFNYNEKMRLEDIDEIFKKNSLIKVREH